MKKIHHNILLVIVILLTFFPRMYRIDNPIADWHSWRQGDTASVTREYVKHGIDILRPRYHDLGNVQSGKHNLEGWRMVEFPNGYFAHVEQKSGLARKLGLLTIGNIIDSSYRGECHAIIVNTGNVFFDIKKGQKIAQIIFHRCYTVDKINYVEELSETDRGNKGFGSTGV